MSSLEQIVFGDRQGCRLLRDVGLPRRENVQIEMEQEDLPAHFPPAGEARHQSAFALLDQVAEVVDDRLTLSKARLRAEEVQRRLDLEPLLIAQRNGVPYLASHDANAGQDGTDLHLQMEEIADRTAIAHADVHVALIPQDRPNERGNVPVGEME